MIALHVTLARMLGHQDREIFLAPEDFLHLLKVQLAWVTRGGHGSVTTPTQTNAGPQKGPSQWQRRLVTYNHHFSGAVSVSVFIFLMF